LSWRRRLEAAGEVFALSRVRRARASWPPARGRRRCLSRAGGFPARFVYRKCGASGWPLRAARRPVARPLSLQKRAHQWPRRHPIRRPARLGRSGNFGVGQARRVSVPLSMPSGYRIFGASNFSDTHSIDRKLQDCVWVTTAQLPGSSTMLSPVF
jgi:hypothetical protein